MLLIKNKGELNYVVDFNRFFVLCFVISCIIDHEIFQAISFGLGIICLASSCIVLACYSWTKTVSAKQIVVLEERNSEVLEQIEPFVEQFLKYEKDSYKELKINSNTVVALSAYPELKGNEFVMKQINIVLENQKKITDLKLAQASLNGYKIWLFMGE